MMGKDPGMWIQEMVTGHDAWRSRCINLMASENVMSLRARALLASDLATRYTLPLGIELDGVLVENAYRGTRFTDQIEGACESLARDVFHAKHANVKPLGGHISGMMMLLAICKRGDLILATSDDNGGYHGYVQRYMPDMFGLRSITFPFDNEEWQINMDATLALIRKKRPRLVILGMSYFPFPYDMAPIREACDDTGSVIGYDASHVLGLVAGGQFQDPLAEGADIMVGSTHKTFFGPQGGLVLTNDEDLHEQVDMNTTWRCIDNAHWNRIAALAHALLEARHFSKDYAAQVVRNSQALARSLDREGVPLRFSKKGYTRSHQVLLDGIAFQKGSGMDANVLAKSLEAQDIIIDAVGRMGTNEVTRLGMKEKEMDDIARLIGRAAKGEGDLRGEANALRSRFGMAYCFDDA